MRISPRRFLPALALLICLRLDSAAQTPINVPEVFTYQAPAGWAKVVLPGSSYPTAVDTSTASGPSQAKAMITVNTDLDNGELGVWCAAAFARNKAQFALLGAQVGELEVFTTAAGATGYRAPVELTARGRPIHYVMYFFNGGNATKVTLTCACGAADASHYVPLFEAAMKTFVPR